MKFKKNIFKHKQSDIMPSERKQSPFFFDDDKASWSDEVTEDGRGIIDLTLESDPETEPETEPETKPEAKRRSKIIELRPVSKYHEETRQEETRQEEISLVTPLELSRRSPLIMTTNPPLIEIVKPFAPQRNQIGLHSNEDFPPLSRSPQKKRQAPPPLVLENSSSFKIPNQTSTEALLAQQLLLKTLNLNNPLRLPLNI